MRKVMRNTIFGLFLLLLFLPMLQEELKLIGEKPLHGAFVPAEMPDFTWRRWFNGEFQENYDRYTEDHIGFRSALVRIQNQLDYTLFREVNAEGVVAGKDDFLYEYDYIRDYTGKAFTGMDFIRKKMMRAKYVQQYLKDSLDIDFIIVFEPGKASFYPEYIPDRFMRDRKDQTNFKAYLALADELGVKHIDFNDYFLEMKDTASYPLFPKYGTHWSVYGMSFVADSLLNYIECLRQQKLREVHIEGYEVAGEPRDTDNDVEKPLNLLFPLASETLAYPVWDIDTASERYRPMVLAVADSYYWNIFNTRIPKHVFANEAFWFFNSKVYPDTYFRTTWVKDLDLQEEVEKQDVIFLMVTERFMYKFDWQFIDSVYEFYVPGWLTEPVYKNMNRAIGNDARFVDLVKKAHGEGIPLEDIIRKEALYLYYMEDRTDYLIHHGVEHYENMIRNAAEWYDHIRQKAGENNIPVEEQLNRDARYTFNQNFPDLYSIHLDLQELVHEMESDLEHLDTLETEGATYGMRLEDYLVRKAYIVYREQEIQRTMHAILSTPEWLASVQEKALEKDLPLDTMIRRDAEYVWEQRVKQQEE